ncbi:MAG: alpha/beta hydrolase-fold protein [Bacteroidota bacterium]
MKKSLAILAILVVCACQTFAQSDGDDVIIGKYRVLDSKVLGEQRRILVHLPDGYENTEVQYPVVFHLYGDYEMTYFADAASLLHRLQSFRLMPGVILVGVDNTDRYRDLRPLKADGNPGGADQFARYFREELIPFIRENYRAADYNILAGPQAGACFGFYSLIEHTDLFDAFILENSFDNPVVIDNYLITKAKDFFKPDKSLNKFLYMKIDSHSPNYQFALKQKSTIEANIPRNFRFRFETFDQGDYMTETGFLKGFRELFSEYELPDSIATGGIDNIIAYYDTLSEKMGFKITPSDVTLHYAATRINAAGNGSEARRVYEYILTVYPKSLDGLFQMAQILSAEGKFQKAVEYYTEFLKLRPHEAMVQNMLKRTERLIRESASFAIEQAINAKGIKEGKLVYQQLRKDNPDKKYFDEKEMNYAGYRFLNKGMVIEAIEIFKMTAEIFPESFNSWDSLGEAYMKKSDKTNAKKSYKKSLELNPRNENAAKMLEQLK